MESFLTSFYHFLSRNNNIKSSKLTLCRFLYDYSSNHPRMSGPAGIVMGYSTATGGAGGGSTTDRRGIIPGGQDDSSSATATTSFIFAPPPTSHMDFNQMAVDCDNRISNTVTNSGLRNSILGGGGRFMSNSQQQPPPIPPVLGLLGGSGNGGGNPSKLANSINNAKTSSAKTASHNLHSDYTIAV
jgi:hypothetical protein